MQSLKKIVKPLIPAPLIKWRSRYINRRTDESFRGQSATEVFSAIYKDKKWGGKESDFYSGIGSHDPKIVAPYVQALTNFISGLHRKPDMVDLGCGDFHVGSQIRDICEKYVACDIVHDLIQRNKKVFSGRNVDFRVLNIMDDPLPEGDVACIRQVLQHLDNHQIGRVVPKLSQYAYIVLTEHLPRIREFQPNRDKPIGPGIRNAYDSGIVLTAPPFMLKPLSEKLLCSVKDDSGIIATIAYQMKR